MHELSIPDANLTWHLPETAQECTPEQYLQLLTVYLQALAEGLTAEQFKIRLAYRFLRLKPGRQKPQSSTQPAGNKHSNLWRIAQLFGGFVAEDSSRATINIHSIVQHFATITHKNKIYRGADDALTNLTFIEFIHADVAARKYAADGDINQLNLLTALIYTRKTWLQKLLNQTAYNPKKTEAAAKKLATLPMVYKIAALNLFQSTIAWWQQGPLEINGVEVDLRILFNQKPTGSTSSNKSTGGFTSVLFTLAETGVFGNAEQTAKASLYDVLLRLHQVQAQANEAAKKAAQKPGKK